MLRRSFLGLLAATPVIALVGLQSEPAQTDRQSHHPDIMYWVVISGKNPFVFGVKNESELDSFRLRGSLRPGRYYDPVEARVACAMPS